MTERKNNIFFITAIATVLALQACNVKRFIPEGELLYTGAEIEIEEEAEIEDIDRVKVELENVLRPDPNTAILGMRPGLYFHYKAQKENPGFINRFLNKRIGEEPVYLSDVEIEQVENLLLNRSENRGFFYTSVSSEVQEDEDDKQAEILYTVELPEPYILEKYKLDEETGYTIYDDIEDYMPDSPIEPGMRFDLELLKFERERIDRKLKEDGYYNFNSGFLIFEADTNQYENKNFDLFLRLKEDVPSKSIIPYRIDQVNVYPNYVVGNDTIISDTVTIEGKNFIQDEVFFRPDRLAPFITLEEGQFYSPERSRNTSRRLTSIGAYKFVNIRYDEIDTLATDSLGILEANIYLSPLNKRALRAELQAVTKSNDFAGPTLALTFSNRNLFHGGEILSLSAHFGYEWQVTSGDQRGLRSIRLGGQADLIFPRLLFPITIKGNWFEYAIPKTKVGLGVEYLSRSDLYSVVTVTGNFGYLWNANRFVTHELNPLSVNYLNLSSTTPEFERILDENPFLRNSFEQQFIAGLTYSFTYNGMVDERNTHQFYLNSTLDVAGNTIDLLASENEDGTKTFFDLEYAQYAKADVDFRYHLRVGSGQKIASRLFAGYGIPYGNSDVLPFSKQYFSGGPYSVRAFQIRSLGPGTYDGDESDGFGFFDRTGNIRLEANLEYRFPIISFLKGAVFADAGNVWNSEEVESLPGGQFGSDFLSELGIGVGAGLRVDIQNFVIRFDLAAPIHSPELPEGDRWRFDYDDPVFNFAIGYPF